MGIATHRKFTGALLAGAVLALTGCEDGGKVNLGQMFKKSPDGATTAASAATGRTIEKDVESPEVFSAKETGLWDGRPSLGGVWVAHPDVKDPERVMIRNSDNGKFVVGALFRRERDIPGPRLQLSSDAAEALGVLAGAPVSLDVVALRRKEVAAEPATPVEADTVAAPAEVSETPLDPIAAAGAAIDAAEPAAAPAAPAPKPKPASSLAKPYLQVGIFSVEANANRTAKQMRGAGMLPVIRPGETAGKPFWRVIVGPASSSAERASLLKKIKAEGFTDAYPVTN